jgi:hypothetical protein
MNARPGELAHVPERCAAGAHGLAFPPIFLALDGRRALVAGGSPGAAMAAWAELEELQSRCSTLTNCEPPFLGAAAFQPGWRSRAATVSLPKIPSGLGVVS